MKRLLYVFALSAALMAQEPAGAKKEEPDEMMGWKWANFAILAAGLGYLIAKNVPPYFRSRTEDIQRGIAEASRMKAEAEAKMAEVESRFASLGSEIEKLKGQLKADMSAEGERIQHDTETMLSRIQEQAEQEISFLIKAARNELRTFSATLALDLAHQRIAGRMTPQTQHNLVDAFVNNLRSTSDGTAR